MEEGNVSRAYLVFGERFLCQETAGELIQRLLPDETRRQTFLKTIDGEKEEIDATINLLKTFSLFGGRQIVRVNDSRLFQSKAVAAAFWEKAEKAYAAKEPVQAADYLGRMLALAGFSPADWQTEIAGCDAKRWQALFGFPQPENLKWVQEVVASTAVREKSGAIRSEAADLLAGALEQGIPASNTLILVAEAVDKRKRLYKFFEKNCAVIDLTVDTGSTAVARKGQEAVLKELVYQTLAPFKKTIEPKCLPILFDRVGFHPVAIVMETEKLALYAGDAPVITLAHLDAMLCRTREEALYELNEAIGEANLAGALLTLKRLQENGMHALAVIAGLRNFLRKLLLARAFQEQNPPNYVINISYPAFQQGYLSQLQDHVGKLPDLLSGHPFVVYKLFRQAEKFSMPLLKNGLEALLWAEYRLKGSGIPEGIILEDFLFSFLRERRKENTMVQETQGMSTK